MSPERLDEESKSLNMDYEGLIGVASEADREVGNKVLLNIEDMEDTTSNQFTPINSKIDTRSIQLEANRIANKMKLQDSLYPNVQSHSAPLAVQARAVAPKKIAAPVSAAPKNLRVINAPKPVVASPKKITAPKVKNEKANLLSDIKGQLGDDDKSDDEDLFG